MKHLLIPLSFVLTISSAAAQIGDTYCLQPRNGPGKAPDCRYATMQQCHLSAQPEEGNCMRNPAK